MANHIFVLVTIVEFDSYVRRLHRMRTASSRRALPDARTARRGTSVTGAKKKSGLHFLPLPAAGPIVKGDGVASCSVACY